MVWSNIPEDAIRLVIDNIDGFAVLIQQELDRREKPVIAPNDSAVTYYIPDDLKGDYARALGVSVDSMTMVVNRQWLISLIERTGRMEAPVSKGITYLTP